MAGLTRKPVTGDVFKETSRARAKKNEVPVVKKDYNASVRITIETRNKLNALRKISKFKNIDDLLEEMIENRVKELNSHDKVKFEVLIEE